MKRFLLTSASAFVLISAVPALAETSAEMNAHSNVQVQTQQESTLDKVGNSLEKGWDKTKEVATDAAEAVKDGTEKAVDATAEAYEDVAGEVVKKSDAELRMHARTDVDLLDQSRASKIIGADIYNGNNEFVGTIEDIIVNADGTTQAVIVGDGTFFGMGDKVAVDYTGIVMNPDTKRFNAAMTQEQINASPAFNYDGIKGYRVSTLLDGQLVDTNNKTIGQIDEIVFTDGQADKLIVGYNKILGLGGEEIVIDFDTPQIVINGEENIDFQVNDQQVSALDAFAKKLTN